MRQPPKHRPERPSCCDVSDLLNEMYSFVQKNPDWMETEDGLQKMHSAYTCLAIICHPDMASQEEYDFAISIINTLKEKAQS